LEKGSSLRPTTIYIVERAFPRSSTNTSGLQIEYVVTHLALPSVLEFLVALALLKELFAFLPVPCLQPRSLRGERLLSSTDTH
jgi:hypothetical protein